MKNWLLLGAAIVFEVTGSLSLKATLEAPGFVVLVVLAYLSAFICLGMALARGVPLGVAYGIWGACGVALTAIFSMLIFGEAITVLMGVGIALVIGGVLCVEVGSHQGERAGVPEGDGSSGVQEGAR